jgi:hypothetical protein
MVHDPAVLCQTVWLYDYFPVLPSGVLEAFFFALFEDASSCTRNGNFVVFFDCLPVYNSLNLRDTRCSTTNRR